MKSLLLKLGFFLLVSLTSCTDENNTPFDKGSGITSIKLTPQKTEDLALLGKVWGFLKYYHPEVAKGKYNWDFELFKILPKIISCKNENERNTILSCWINNLGSIGKSSVYIIDSAKVKCYPDLDWIYQTSELGGDLSGKLIEIKTAKRTGENHYIKLEEDVYPIFTNEDSYKQFKYPDTGYRLLSLFRYWNIVQYYYPYKYLIGEDWKNVLVEFIPKFVNDSDQIKYKLTVFELTARIHDAHSLPMIVWMNDPVNGSYLAPVKLLFIENKAVVTGYYDDKFENKCELKVGDIILKIKNKSTDDFVKEKQPFIPASNYPTQLRNIASILLLSQDSSVYVTFERDGIVKSINIRCFSINYFMSMHKKEEQHDTCFRYLSPNIGYIFPETFKHKYIDSLIPLVSKTKGLVIDYRGYPAEGGFTDFAEYFLPKSMAFAKSTHTNMDLPGLFTFAGINDVGHSNSKFYKGRVVIIVNEMTQSQAEWDVMAFRCAPKTIVIGSSTAGADGAVMKINLVGGIITNFSGNGVYYPDGRETQRIGIIPDVEVHPTIKGIREGKDELLEMAIEIINSK